MRYLRWITVLAIAPLALLGCAGSGATSSPSAAQPASATPAANSLTIAFEDNCQFEIIAPSGQRILIDVYDPTQLTSPAKASDILLTTHLHADHYSQTFEESFPGQKITNQTTEATFGDVKVKSIAASHDDTAIDAANPTNHIFVIEINGFKIVHGGSTGQLQLTSEQLAAIGGDVDVAMMVLMNVGGTDPSSTKAIDIVNQVNPKVVIPTHSVMAYVQAVGRQWAATFSSKVRVTIPHDQLPAKTTMLLMGLVGPSYGAVLNAPETDW